MSLVGGKQVGIFVPLIVSLVVFGSSLIVVSTYLERAREAAMFVFIIATIATVVMAILLAVGFSGSAYTRRRWG